MKNVISIEIGKFVMRKKLKKIGFIEKKIKNLIL